MKLHKLSGILAAAAVTLMGCSAVERVAQSVADSARGSAAPAASAAPATETNPPPAAGAPVGSKPTQAPATGSKAVATAPAPAAPEAKPSATAAAPAKPTREVIPMGGYDWEVVSKSEGSIKLQTKGLPTEQIAIDAANMHCKKFGRLAQTGAPPQLVLFTWWFYSFNCMR